jgi:hypothetical protein
MIPVNATLKEVIENYLGLDYEKQDFLLSKIYAMEQDIDHDIATELGKDIDILSEKLSLIQTEMSEGGYWLEIISDVDMDECDKLKTLGKGIKAFLTQQAARINDLQDTISKLKTEKVEIL